MKYIFLIVLLTTIKITFSQNYCPVTKNTNYRIIINPIQVNASNIINRYIKVNIFFLLKDDGTGNFNELNDGLYPADSYNGYKYAWDLINRDHGTNNHLKKNYVMRQQTATWVPSIETKLSYILNEVYFIRNTYDYNLACNFSVYPSYFGAKYATDPNCMNIFLSDKSASARADGVADANKNCTIMLAYKEYKTSVQLKDWWRNTFTVKSIVHEIAHNLQIWHPLGGDGCGENPADDGCVDTPTWQYLASIGNPRPCDWNDTIYGSNNLMDYNADQNALSPCQIYTMHTDLVNNKSSFQICDLLLQDLTTTSFSDSKILYAGKNLTFYSTSIPNNLIIKTGQIKNIIYSKSVTLSAGFEVQEGAALTIEQMDQCQTTSTNELPKFK